MDQNAIRELQDGFRLQQDGALEAAAAKYQQVLARFPANEHALNLIGVICLRRGEFPAAIEYLQRARLVNDDDSETHNNLGLAYAGIHEFDQARRAFESSLKLKPGQPIVLNNLGNAFASLDRHVQAIKCFDQALVLNPAYVDGLSNLCMSLVAERKFESALRAIDKAIGLAPQRALSFSNKGKVLNALLRYAEAARCFEAAIALDATLIEARIHLSTSLKQLRREASARATLDHVLQVDPENFEAHKCMGILLEQMGDFTGAALHFRQAIRLSPNHASAYYQLSKLSGERLTASERCEVQRLLDDQCTHERLRGPLLFALACDLEKQHDYTGSLACFIQGNRARSHQSTYDAAADDAYYNSVRSTYPVQLPPCDEVTRGGGFVPIFVLGMPRSGTTLTEQILASHSRIAGAGESGLLSGLALEAQGLTNAPFPQCCRTLSPDNIRALRASYIAGITALAGASDYIVDKTPMNYQLIGFIAMVFPGAKIIYCKRGALDNCLSIFKLPFDETQSYSHDLTSLGHYYRNHERLMEFWHECYPGWIHTVEYERTTEDLESQARDLLAFVGVDFETEVLRFYANDRMILTPSAQQVRRPIYRYSVGAWRKYGDGLQPLIQSLGVNPSRPAESPHARAAPTCSS